MRVCALLEQKVDTPRVASFCGEVERSFAILLRYTTSQHLAIGFLLCAMALLDAGRPAPTSLPWQDDTGNNNPLPHHSFESPIRAVPGGSSFWVSCGWVNGKTSSGVSSTIFITSLFMMWPQYADSKCKRRPERTTTSAHNVSTARHS